MPSPFRSPAPRPRGIAVLLLGVSALASGCTPSVPSPSPDGSPAARSSAPSAATGGIAHPTGATDVVLRVSITGGFVPIEAAAGRVPVFTLYGDGRVVVQPEDVPPGAAPAPLREARLDPVQIQDLLASAIGPGGLGIAATDYASAGSIDSATTVITIDAGGLRKEVRILALDAEPVPGPEQAPREAFARLVARLRAVPTAGAFEPDGFVAVLVETEPDPGDPPRAWPWPDLVPADFAPPQPEDPLGVPTRTLGRDELDALGTGIPAAGLVGPTVEGPDGRVYRIVLRPRLPDEPPAR